MLVKQGAKKNRLIKCAAVADPFVTSHHVKENYVNENHANKNHSVVHLHLQKLKKRFILITLLLFCLQLYEYHKS